MEYLDIHDNETLLRFLHLNKTELSCMDKPQTFVRQLRDFSLISKEEYSKISRMKSSERIRSAVYNVLDFIETKRPQHIQRFWRCAFKETILNNYPTLRLLRNSLFDGSYACESALLEAVDNQESDTERKEKLEEELEVKKVGSKNRKKRKNTIDDDDNVDEQPSTSAQVTPRLRKRPKRLCFGTPLKKGEKGDIWTWDIFKVHLPVTCGDTKGTLNRDRLAKGEKCILKDKQWYTPCEFERLAGKETYKNWKLSIRCNETALEKLLKEGHLKCIGYKGASKAKKHLFPSEETITVSEVEDDSSDSTSRESSSDSTDLLTPEEQEENDDGLDPLPLETRNKPNRVLKVMCEDISGLLHTKRFASGTCGRSIRTETCWMTPVDFVKEASCQTDISWKKHIKYEGKPLGELLKEKVLEIHSLLCNCSLCVPDSDELDNEKNDDECWICYGEGTEEEILVACDECPRSFHQKCHLPHILDAALDDGRQWYCTPCVFFKTLNLYPELEKEAVMSSLISDHMLHCQYLLLTLYRADEDCIFKSDPCHLPEYTRVISTPMCFDQVADKLQRNRYQTVGQFVSDIQLIFTNCASYNRNNPEFLSIGTQIEKLFKGELNKVFKLQQDSESESELILYIPEGETLFVSDIQSTSK